MNDLNFLLNVYHRFICYIFISIGYFKATGRQTDSDEKLHYRSEKYKKKKQLVLFFYVILISINNIVYFLCFIKKQEQSEMFNARHVRHSRCRHSYILY